MSSYPTVTPPAASGGSGRVGALAGKAKSGIMAGGKAAHGCLTDSCAGFRDFILRGNVVDLAVAIVVGAAFTELIKTFVSSFITPLISAIWGGASFESLYFTINGSQFTYGKFINALLSFIIICLIVYFLVVMPMMKLLAVLDPKTARRPCPECLEEVAAGAQRCKFCTSTIPVAASLQTAMAEDAELKKELDDVRANKV